MFWQFAQSGCVSGFGVDAMRFYAHKNIIIYDVKFVVADLSVENLMIKSYKKYWKRYCFYNTYDKIRVDSLNVRLDYLGDSWAPARLRVGARLWFWLFEFIGDRAE